MEAVKLLLAFTPWIAFWIISGGHSMLRLQIAIAVAAVLVVLMGITRLHRGVILWAGVIFFTFALISVAWLKLDWVIHRMGLLASGTLFLAAFLSVAIGRPFTEDYARERVPRELWDSPSFIRGCFATTSVWAFIFLANTLVNVTKLYYPDAGEWTYEGAQICFLVLGVVFTTTFSRVARRKRNLAAGARIISE
jgi:hypothetical protein